jgi:NADH-quinone oxidoreductase subunit L
VGWFSTVVRRLQSGYIYHYAFVMIIGVLFFLLYFMPPTFAK